MIPRFALPGCLTVAMLVVPHWLPTAVCSAAVQATCREDLARAAAVAEDDVTRRRVEMATASFRLDELQFKAIRARERLRQEPDNQWARRELEEAVESWRCYYQQIQPLGVRKLWSHYEGQAAALHPFE